MWEKEKLSKSLQNGVIALIFLMLSVQFVFFVIKAVDVYRRPQKGEENAIVELEKELPLAQDSVKKSYMPKQTVKKIPVKKNQSSRPVEEKVVPSKPENTEIVSSQVSQGRKWKWDDVELNSADSATLTLLPGIGPYYAAKIVEYRERLWGSFVSKEQLMEIRGIDSQVFSSFADRVWVDSSLVRYINLETISQDSLSLHPYVGAYAAKGIERYRRINSEIVISRKGLVENGILSEGQAERLFRYVK